MSDRYSLLHNALFEYNKAENEVERLLDIIDQATIDLDKARQSKRAAKIQLDEAIASATGVSLSSSLAVNKEAQDSSHSEYYSSEEEESSQSCSSSGSDDDEEERNESIDESEEGNQFHIADQALDQIRYRLKVAKIDPNSPQGASLLDELLIRMKRSDDTISDGLIDEIMDDLLNGNDGSFDEEESDEDLIIGNGKGSDNEVESNNEDDESCEEEDSCDDLKRPRIQISRRGKVLGWYEGGLDDRGYAREGEGTMFYNAGHVCSGYWKDDEIDGRGVYKWADGHIYDVSGRILLLVLVRFLTLQSHHQVSPTALPE